MGSAKILIYLLVLLQIVHFYEGRNEFNKVIGAPITGTAKKSESFWAFAAQRAILSDIEVIFTLLVAVAAGRVQCIFRRALTKIKLDHRPWPLPQDQALTSRP